MHISGSVKDSAKLQGLRAEQKLDTQEKAQNEDRF